MTQHAREPAFRGKSISYLGRALGRSVTEIDHSDPLLELAYTVSEWAITFVGPIFWMCLTYLFVATELD